MRSTRWSSRCVSSTSGARTIRPTTGARRRAVGRSRRGPPARHNMLDATLTRNTDLALSDEQQDFVRALRDFAAKEVNPELIERYENDHHSDELAARLAELGWWSLCIDEEYGGSGGTFSDAVLLLEETARGRVPVAGYGVTLIVVGALNKFG